MTERWDEQVNVENILSKTKIDAVNSYKTAANQENLGNLNSVNNFAVFNKTTLLGNENGSTLYSKNGTESTLFGALKDDTVSEELFSDQNKKLMAAEALTKLDEVVSKESLEQMEQLGLSPKDGDPASFVTIDERIQIKLAAYSDDYKLTSSISASDAKEVLNSAVMANDAAMGTNANVSIENTSNKITKDELKTEQALKEIESIKENGGINEVAKVNMLKQGLEPTIGNVYKSEFSGAATEGHALTESEWGSLKPQAESVIEAAGLTVNEESLSDAKWMIERDIPLNVETMQLNERIDSVNFNLTTEEIDTALNNAYKMGIEPENVVLSNDADYISRAKEAMETLNNANSNDLNYIIKNNNELTLESLKLAKEEQKNEEIVENAEENPAKRQTFLSYQKTLVEAQLVMSVSSTARMFSLGIKVETTALSALVNDTKIINDTYYSALLSATGTNPESMVFVTDAENNLQSALKMTSLQMFSAAMYSKTQVQVALTVHEEEFVSSVSELYVSAGNTQPALTDVANRALKLYEDMATEVRADLGDRISKAFANMDSLLSELGFELTDENRKVARILGRNSMELTKENFDGVSKVSRSLENLVKNMTPETVTYLIKKGINPLNEDIETLNSDLEEINHSLTTGSSEKYAEYLVKADRKKEFSETQREQYVGMYRLLNWVTKNDGSVVGALYKSKADVNLRNLLSAARSKRVQGIDVSLDETFGLSEVTRTEDLEQIIDSIETNEIPGEAKEDADLLRDSFKRFTPDVAGSILNKENAGDITPRELNEITNVTPDTQKAAYYEEEMQTIDEASRVSEEILIQMMESGMSVSVNNAITAQAFFSGSIYQNGYFKDRRFINRVTEAESLEELNEAIRELSEKSGEIEDAVKSGDYSNISDEVKNDEFLTDITNNRSYSAQEFRDVMLLNSVAKTMEQAAKNNTYVVMTNVDNRDVILNLKFRESEDSKTTSEVTYESSTFGEIKAVFKLENGSVSADITVEKISREALIESSRTGLTNPDEILQAKVDAVAMAANGENVAMGNINLYRDTKLMRTFSGNTDVSAVEYESAKTKDMDVLYKVSKKFVAAFM